MRQDNNFGYCWWFSVIQQNVIKNEFIITILNRMFLGHPRLLVSSILKIHVSSLPLSLSLPALFSAQDFIVSNGSILLLNFWESLSHDHYLQFRLINPKLSFFPELEVSYFVMGPQLAKKRFNLGFLIISIVVNWRIVLENLYKGRCTLSASILG